MVWKTKKQKKKKTKTTHAKLHKTIIKTDLKT